MIRAKHVNKNNPTTKQFSALSATLGQQFEGVLDKADLVGKAYRKELLKVTKQITAILPYALINTSSKDECTFRKQGLDAFSDEAFKARFEHALYHGYLNADTCTKKKIFRPLNSLLRKLVFFYLNAETEIIEADISYAGRQINLYRLNVLPLKQALEAKAMVTQVLDGLEHQRNLYEQSKTRVYQVITTFLKVFERCINDSDMIKRAASTGISIREMLTNEKYYKEFLKICSQYAQKNKRDTDTVTFQKCLQVFAPEVHGELKHVEISTDVKVTAYLAEKYPLVLKQINEYLKVFDYDKSSKETKLIFKAFRFLKNNHQHFSSGFFQDLHNFGLEAFIINEGAAWLKFKELDDLQDLTTTDKARAYTRIGRLLTHVMGSPCYIKRFTPYEFEFPSRHAIGKSEFIRIDLLKDYPVLNGHFKELHKVQMNRTDGEKLDPLTVQTSFELLRGCFKAYLPLLSEFDRSLVADLGVNAFVKNDNSILKQIRQRIQFHNKAGKLSTLSAKKYQRELNNLLTFFGLQTIKSYPVATKKRKKHIEKATEIHSLYSFEEVVEIAYYIEVALKQISLTHQQLISLMVARVILKTAWNVTPTLELDADDIFLMSSPLDGVVSPCVRLFKKRANYQTQWHKYNIPADCLENEGVVIGKKVRPVFLDLMELKNKICASARDAMPSEHPLKSRLLVYYSEHHEHKDWIGLSSSSLNTHSNHVLEQIGCSVRFVPKRIRKSGLNYIYKKVAKSFKKYKKAGQHSFEVFLKYYLKSNANESKMALTNALKVMGDYFNDRVLTEDIIILTEPPSNSKQTPNGSCVSEGNNDASSSYNKKHHKLHKKNDTKPTPCADFNACLFCPYYRLVADEEHVWRLLSYRKYVLSQMRNSIGEYDNQAQQQIYAQTLEKRVDEILNTVSKLNSTAVPKGEALLSAHGIHPDWALVA